jgi:predicted phosphodiesterase
MIWFLGDNHGRFDYIAKAIDAAPTIPKAVILLGDLEAPIPLHECMRDVESRGVDWYWIIGNHDTDSLQNYTNISDQKSMECNIDGRVIEIGGVRVAGFGGVFRGEIWYPTDADKLPSFESFDDYRRSSQEYRRLKARLSKRDRIQAQAVPSEFRNWQSQLLDLSRAGKLLKHRSTIFPDVYRRLMSLRADILVTHEAPSCHQHGFEVIDHLARALRVTDLFHGHHHEARDYSAQLSLLGFRAHGVGFREIAELRSVSACVSPLENTSG